jgi:cyclopropane fatty-acyl-phospholipid synthase-like methyltransferase
MTDASRLFSEKHESYVRFIRAVRYPQGLRAFFLRSPLLRSGMRVLDAGCGTGVVTLALRDALVSRSLSLGPMHAFDLTPAMLERFRATLARRGIQGVETVQANALELDALPESWRGYDLIVSASMLEYVPRERFAEALRALRSRLHEDGRFVLFITRRNWLTRPLIGRWWRSNLYDAAELRDAFARAGFSGCEFRHFPREARLLALWGYVVEAANGAPGTA